VRSTPPPKQDGYALKSEFTVSTFCCGTSSYVSRMEKSTHQVVSDVNPLLSPMLQYVALILPEIWKIFLNKTSRVHQVEVLRLRTDGGLWGRVILCVEIVLELNDKHPAGARLHFLLTILLLST